MKQTMKPENHPCATNAKTTGPAFSMTFFGVLTAVGVRYASSLQQLQKTQHEDY